MADLFLTDADTSLAQASQRITVLEQQLKSVLGRVEALEVRVLGRVEALEVREAQRERQEAGPTAADNAYLQAEIFGAVEGSKQADTLNHFQ